MAPKLWLLQRRKSMKSLEAEKRRQRAAQIPAQASPPRISSKVPLSARKVALGRKIDFSFLRRDSFSIEEKIVKQRWRFFCCLSEPVYIDSVKEFYSNLMINDGFLRSIVKDVEIVMNATKLG